ncbi:uncharacterized protein PHALS_02819 [Plasmopara halstedii]|uniref:Uncharacterized protein n=1 Tax=Plasmopara halstedii TaxID=4781 RepID=A0A0P1AY26_PLAHL|nr:uncharacterized protein PHALS_02819 [Plasmopara halstedii]CEG46416.1 hypothetical protein PHALS_02819 [Plasmopara halstedii]|eukprot:XP_024582785.1 hypothetical protein PHALS_02819 [Plasmopara halstedii]
MQVLIDLRVFQQVMAKIRDYEYDQITKKTLEGSRGPPGIIKGEVHVTPKASKKKHTYVPQSTDADFNMEEPTAPEDSSDDFYSGMNDVAQRSSILEYILKKKRF